MMPQDESIAIPLLSFNVGLEVGQIVIVFLLLLLSYLFITVLNTPRKIWVYLLSAVALITAIKMIVGRLLF